MPVIFRHCKKICENRIELKYVGQIINLSQQNYIFLLNFKI